MKRAGNQNQHQLRERLLRLLADPMDKDDISAAFPDCKNQARNAIGTLMRQGLVVNLRGGPKTNQPGLYVRADAPEAACLPEDDGEADELVTAPVIKRVVRASEVPPLQCRGPRSVFDLAGAL